MFHISFVFLDEFFTMFRSSLQSLCYYAVTRHKKRRMKRNIQIRRFLTRVYKKKTSRKENTVLWIRPSNMKTFQFFLGLATISATAVAFPSSDEDRQDQDFGVYLARDELSSNEDPVFPTYGPHVEKEGFCPRDPIEGLCDCNDCSQVRYISYVHCQ